MVLNHYKVPISGHIPILTSHIENLAVSSATIISALDIKSIAPPIQ